MFLQLYWHISIVNDQTRKFLLRDFFSQKVKARSAKNLLMLEKKGFSLEIKVTLRSFQIKQEKTIYLWITVRFQHDDFDYPICFCQLH